MWERGAGTREGVRGLWGPEVRGWGPWALALPGGPGAGAHRLNWIRALVLQVFEGVAVRSVGAC